MPRAISDPLLREVPLLERTDSIRHAAGQLVEAGVPALPVVNADGTFAGIFGEREFMQALFPGYVGSLKGAGFVGRSVQDALEKRAACAVELVEQHMNDERVAVREDFSDMQVAEVFLHHRVLIVPVLREKQVTGVITRSAFFTALAERFLDS